MNRFPLLALTLVSALASLVPAQVTALPDDVGKPVAGQKLGQMSYLATFTTRSFTLENFRQAILARRPAAEVAEIVADYERLVARDQAAFRAAVQALGGNVTIQYWLVNACAFEIEPNKVAQLALLPGVAEIHADRIAVPLIKTSTSAANHNADAVQAAGIKGVGVCSAIMDTGQDAVSGATGKPHATYYIDGNTSNTAGGGIMGSRLVANVQCGTLAPEDPHNHGTAVASQVAGAIWNLSGTADDGHAPRATIAGYSISNSTSGGSSEAVMALAWQNIARDKAKYNIVSANNSYTGISCNTTDLIQKALDNAAYYADIVCCTAAGNSAGSTTYSQACANGLSTAAVNPTAKTMASFSSYGPLSCDAGRFWPDISGCGVNTVMALRDNAASSWTASGTSMASPQTCGAATLVRGVNPTLNAQETKAILLATAESIAAQNAGRTRYNFGLGFVRSDLSVQLAQTAGSAWTRTLENATAVHSFQMGVSSGKPYRVVVCWPRRLDTSTSANWSNLKLRVLDGTTVVATSDTPKNLYEHVDFTAAATSVYTIEVSANSLEGAAPIEYSVAHTGTPLGNVNGLFSVYGAGCVGSVSGGPNITSAGVPRLGENWRVIATTAKPSTNALLIVGASGSVWGTTPLPFDLSGIGATNCWINASVDATVPTTTTTSGDAWAYLRIPSTLPFLGGAFYTQWLVVDPGVNPLGIVTTQGGKAVIGGQP